MASEEESGPPPFPPEALAPASAAGSQHSAPPADPPLSLAQPVSARDPGCRLLLLEENGFQALTQEPLFKRPRTTRDAPSPGEGDLLHLPFPKKLWKLVNSSQFASIWWDNDGTCIGINEKLFQEEVLEREGPNKVFETDCMKSFVRQLNLYGFSKLQQDIHTFTCLTNSLPGGAPLCVPSKVTADAPAPARGPATRLWGWRWGWGGREVGGWGGSWSPQDRLLGIGCLRPPLRGGDSD